jgi:hypothetical protein
VIEAVLESERPTYHVGGQIRLRVGLHNTASAPASFSPYPPQTIVKLIITRSDGSEVEPPGSAAVAG